MMTCATLLNVDGHDGSRGITLAFRMEGADILGTQVVAMHDDIVAGQLQLCVGGRPHKTAVQCEDDATVLLWVSTCVVTELPATGGEHCRD